MFNSGSAYAEGRRAGFGGYPRDLGRYDAVSRADYEAGYADGAAARKAQDAA